MSAPTVSISEVAHQLLQELAAQTGQPMLEVLDRALAAYQRQLFFTQLNTGYAELRADPQARAEHLAERKPWDATLLDGLDPEERWTEDGHCLNPEQDLDQEHSNSPVQQIINEQLTPLREQVKSLEVELHLVCVGNE